MTRSTRTQAPKSTRYAEHNARYARLAALNVRSAGLSLMTPDSVARDRETDETPAT